MASLQTLKNPRSQVAYFGKISQGMSPGNYQIFRALNHPLIFRHRGRVFKTRVFLGPKKIKTRLWPG